MGEPKNEKEALAMALADFAASTEGKGFAQHMQKIEDTRKRLGLTYEQFEELYLLGGEDRHRFTIRTNRRNASRPRKKQWAVKLADDLARQYRKFPDAWESIDPDGLKIYRSKDNQKTEMVCYSDINDGDDHLQKETFRKHYFQPAKKNIKKNNP